MATHYYPPSSRELMGEMMGNMKASLRELIEGSDWMDGVTRDRALEKVEALDLVAAYPLELLDPRLVAGLYPKIGDMKVGMYRKFKGLANEMKYTVLPCLQNTGKTKRGYNLIISELYYKRYTQWIE